MNSLGEECNELKKKYDECFNQWFGEFLKGNQADTCHVLFKEYKKCLDKHLKEKGIDVAEAHRKVLETDNEQRPKSDHQK